MEIDLTLDSGSDDELVVLDETAGGKGDGGTGAGRQRASRSASASGSAAARNGKMNVQSVAVIDSDDEAPKAGKRRRGVTDGKRARDSDGDEDSVVSFGWGGSDVVSGKRGGKRAAKSAGPAKSTNPVPVPAKVLDSDEEACEPDSKYARKKRKQSTVAKARKHKLPKAIPRYGVGASIAPPAPIPFAPPPQLPIIPARVSSTSYRASLASMIPSSWSAMANAAGFPLSSQVAGLASRFYGAPLKPTGPAPALRRVRILRSPSGDLRYADSHNPVSTDDAEDFSSIANQFFHFATEDEGSFKITAIEIVLVEKSLHKYEACRERFASAGREAKEMLVFHGTRAENVEGILGEGFKVSVGGAVRLCCEDRVYLGGAGWAERATGTRRRFDIRAKREIRHSRDARDSLLELLIT